MDRCCMATAGPAAAAPMIFQPPLQAPAPVEQAAPAQLALPAPSVATPKAAVEPSTLEKLEVVAPVEEVQKPRILKPQLSIEDKKPNDEIPSEPAPDATQSNMMLEQALDDRKKDKKDTEQCVNKKPSGKAPPRKKPASNSKKLKATPEPKAPPPMKKQSLKRPDRAPTPMPSNKKRLAERPHGCSKCRWVPGCCPSCWAGRGYIV